MPNRNRLVVSLTKAENAAIRKEVKRLGTRIEIYCRKRLLWGLDYEDPMVPEGLKQEIAAVRSFNDWGNLPAKPEQVAIVAAAVQEASKHPAVEIPVLPSQSQPVAPTRCSTPNPHIHEDDGHYEGGVWVKD